MAIDIAIQIIKLQNTVSTGVILFFATYFNEATAIISCSYKLSLFLFVLSIILGMLALGTIVGNLANHKKEFTIYEKNITKFAVLHSISFMSAILVMTLSLLFK